MATMGNCGAAGGTNFSLVSPGLHLIGLAHSFASLSKITQLGFGFYSGTSASKTVLFRLALYKKGATIEGSELAWLSTGYSDTWSGSGSRNEDIPVEIWITPGTYYLAVLICSYTGVLPSLSHSTGGSIITSYRKSITSCIDPPSPAGLFTYSNTGTYRSCVTYEATTTGEVFFTTTSNQRTCLDFDPISVVGLDDKYVVPFNLTLPNPSTLNVEAEAYSYDYDYDSIGPSSIVVVGHSYAIRWQEKAFYVAGLYWVFWSDTDRYMYYSTSSDGISWTPKTLIDAVNYKYGETCGVVYDGTYFHLHIKKSQDLYIRVGTPESNGTITWKAALNKILSATGAYTLTDHSYMYGTNGISWCGWHFAMTGGGVSALDLYVNNSTHDITGNGIWGSNLTGTKISDTSYRGNLMRALPGGKVVLLAARITETLKEFYFNGSSWSGPLSVTLNGTVEQYVTGGENWAYDAVVDEFGNIHLSYLDSANRVWYSKRDYDSGSWSPERLLFTGSRIDHDTKIVYDELSGDLYVFIAHAPTTDHVGFCRYDAQKNVWYPIMDFIDASDVGLSIRTDSTDWGGLINTSNKVREDRIPLIYSVNGHILRCKILLFRSDLLEYRFKQWEDSSTNPSRTINFTGSTFGLEYDKYKSCLETQDLLPWLRINHKIPTVVLFDEIIKSSTEHVEEILNLFPNLLNTFKLTVTQVLSLTETISYLWVPTVYTFARILLGRKKAYTLIQRLGAKIKRRGQEQENS